MKGANVMYDYRGKVAGIVISAICIVVLVVQKLTDFIVIEKLNAAQHFNIILWFTLLGLVTIAFSKEKNEDERVQHIRAKSFMYVFLITTGATLAFAFTVTLMPTQNSDMANGVTLTKDDIIEAGRMLMFYPAIGIVIYLVMFHIGLYFDQTWDYKDEAWTVKRLWKDKRYRLAVMIGGLLIIYLIAYLIQ